MNNFCPFCFISIIYPSQAEGKRLSDCIPFYQLFFSSPHLFILPSAEDESCGDSALLKFCLQSSRWCFMDYTVALLLKTINVRFSVYHMPTQHFQGLRCLCGVQLLCIAYYVTKLLLRCLFTCI